MKIVSTLAKRNIAHAMIAGAAFSLLSNYAFNIAGECFFSASTVNTANNLLDLFQLTSYLLACVKRFGKVSKWDLPHVFGMVLSLSI